MTNKSKKRREDDIQPMLVQEPYTTTWERHGQSIIAAIVLLVMSWVGVNVSDGVKNDAVIATQMLALQSQVSKLETTLTSDMKDRYRGSDAIRDFAAIHKELDRVSEDNDDFMREQSSRGPRINALEAQIKELSTELHGIQLKIK